MKQRATLQTNTAHKRFKTQYNSNKQKQEHDHKNIHTIKRTETQPNKTQSKHTNKHESGKCLEIVHASSTAYSGIQ